MGKLTLFFVLAAVLGGTILTLGTQETLSDALRLQTDGQADVIAREIAESGQNVALAQVVGPDGFRSLPSALAKPIAYGGGEFEVHVTDTSLREMTLTVTGRYGGAVHSIHSTYEFDPLEAPGPIWLDVPYATGAVTKQAVVSGGAEGKAVQFDRRKHDELKLGSFLPIEGTGGLRDKFGRALATNGSNAGFGVPDAAEWDALYEDLNVRDVDGLYDAALSSMDAQDKRFNGGASVKTATQWGGAERVTFVDGDLTVTKDGRLRGDGALVVNGNLVVEKGGLLEWGGLVVVRDTSNVLKIQLDGDVRVNGAIAVTHQALPPGGHLDVSVYRDKNGMTDQRPWGSLSGGKWGTRYPFFQHTHAFDQTPETNPRGSRVYFLEKGTSGRHEWETQFRSLLQQLKDEEVYLEFGNPQDRKSVV